MLKTLTLEADVTPNGLLRLDVPLGLPPGKVEVVLVVNPLYRPDLPRQAAVSSLEGIWQGFFPPNFDLGMAIN